MRIFGAPGTPDESPVDASPDIAIRTPGRGVDGGVVGLIKAPGTRRGMNLLDEAIPAHQRQLLHGWYVRVREIGVEPADVGYRPLRGSRIELPSQPPQPQLYGNSA